MTPKRRILAKPPYQLGVSNPAIPISVGDCEEENFSLEKGVRGEERRNQYQYGK